MYIRSCYNFGKQNGYTLVELLVVFSIIGMLTALAIPSYNYTIEQSALFKMRADLNLIDSAFNSYMMQNGGTAPTIEELKKSGFLDSTLRPPLKALGRQLNSKQYEIDQNLNRAFLQLDENTRFYANSTLPL